MISSIHCPSCGGNIIKVLDSYDFSCEFCGSRIILNKKKYDICPELARRIGILIEPLSENNTIEKRLEEIKKQIHSTEKSIEKNRKQLKKASVSVFFGCLLEALSLLFFNGLINYVLDVYFKKYNDIAIETYVFIGLAVISCLYIIFSCIRFKRKKKKQINNSIYELLNTKRFLTEDFEKLQEKRTYYQTVIDDNHDIVLQLNRTDLDSLFYIHSVLNSKKAKTLGSAILLNEERITKELTKRKKEQYKLEKMKYDLQQQQMQLKALELKQQKEKNKESAKKAAITAAVVVGAVAIGGPLAGIAAHEIRKHL